jgi:hypothetical protein
MRSPKVVGAIVVLCMLALAGAGAVWEWRPWHERLSPGAAAAALQRELHLSVRYRCERASRDVGDKLEDVDYVCAPAVSGSKLPAYWIATDSSRITGVEPVH